MELTAFGLISEISHHIRCTFNTSISFYLGSNPQSPTALISWTNPPIPTVLISWSSIVGTSVLYRPAHAQLDPGKQDSA